MRGIMLALAAGAACASPPVQTASPPARTTAGDVVVVTNKIDASTGAIWIDSVGHFWMDAAGGLHIAGRDDAAIGLTREQIATLSAPNMFAHLDVGDSLEVALSSWGAERATSHAVADFARRMVDEHSAHRRMALDMASANGVVPMAMLGDSADVVLATRATAHLNTVPHGDGFDRELMGAEVMMHRHMLRDLQMAQPHATGAARRLVDQTIPIVQQHLSAATALWQRLGGSTAIRQP